MSQSQMIVEGLVERCLRVTAADLRSLSPETQVDDVRRLGAKRPGQAVPLEAILQRAGVMDAATHLGLHSTLDDFHASIPLAAVRDRAVIIYGVDDQPLSVGQGGPFRFFIPDHAACHLDEIDECANVKFLDRMELTQGKGFDNRPQTDQEHAQRHEHEG